MPEWLMCFQIQPVERSIDQCEHLLPLWPPGYERMSPLEQKRHATHQQFLAFAQSLVTLKKADDDTNMQHWTVEERRDFLNWCLEKGLLHIVEYRLLPVGQEV